LNLDKFVNKLTDRVEKLDSSNGNKKLDGINYWKGKKIISLEEWFRITRSNYLSNPDKHKIKEGLEYLPNSYCEMIFPLGVPDDIIENVNAWHKDYIELMDYNRNEDLGKRKCRDCLLSPNNEGSYFGLYKFVANAIDITQYDDSKDGNTNISRNYPCQIVNFYKCPYQTDKVEQHNLETITRKDLFSLNKIAEIVGRALSKALDVKGTRIIYEINFESHKVQEIDTFLCGDPYAQNLPGGKPIEHGLKEILRRIEKLSILPMRNLDDIFEILTNKEKLDIVLEIGLDRQNLEHRNEIIEFFMSIKGNVRRQDLLGRTFLFHSVENQRCSVCSQPANLNCVNCFRKDIWICMAHLKKHKVFEKILKGKLL
jgi:hypothetical protein